MGVYGVDIGYRSAMGIFTPHANPSVAVIDTGVALDHPEIKANLLNGGWDFVENRSFALDQNGHGTLVASIIAGVSGNGIGMNGISTAAKIFPLRVGNDIGSLQTTAIVSALLYAASNGVRIVNCSFGSLNYSSMQYDAFSQLRAKGILAVIAAGNGGSDHIGDNNDVTPTYPANYNLDNIISVAAVGQNGSLAGFSNYGPNSVHIAAPGTNIYGADVKFNVTQSVNFNSIPAQWTTRVLPGSASTRLWSQFVDNLGSGWLSSSAISGTTSFYLNLTDSYAQSPPITLGFAPTLFYWAAYDLEYLYDWVFIEVSVNGGASWQVVDSVTGNNITPSQGTPGTQRRIDLSGYDFQTVSLRFHLQTDYTNNQFYGFYLKGYRIQEVDLFQYDGSQYQFNNGTSFSAPIVTGIAAMLMSQRPDLNYLQIKVALLQTATPIPANLQEKTISGGMVNAYAALQAAIAMPTATVTNTAAPTVIEFYNTNLDNYFITADYHEAAAIDGGSAGPGWIRTGNTFKSGGPTSVCRFYGSQSPGPNSHFYTADAGECAYIKQIQATTPATEKRWNYESLDFLTTVQTNGICPTGTMPVYRAYNNGFARGVDSNHRISTSLTAIQQAVARGWTSEGVVMCAPQ